MCARLARHLWWARSAGWRTEPGSVGVMAKAAGTPGWSELEAGAPQIARLGMERLASTRVAMLATLRPDGSPRISPVEPCLAGGCLLVGAMSWSRKAADLRRDPRYALHSSIADPDSGTGELKLHGRAAIASPPTRHQAAAAWWSALPPQSAEVFVLGIEQALFVEWDIPHAVMTVHRWSPRRGYSHSTRIYP
jgi:Pyridoxamine 5'-phosphate oxidase